MKLNIKLKNLRIDHDLTQKVLAEKIGISRERYSNYEQGIRTPDYEILITLANLYKISLDELFGYEKKVVKKGGQTFDHEKLIFKTKMHEDLFHQINMLNETQLSIVKDIINSLIKTNPGERKESI